MPSDLSFSATDVTVGSAVDDVTLVTVPNVSQFSTATFEVANADGGAALTSFKVKLQDHPDGEFYDYLTDDDFANGNLANLRFCTTTNPKTLAANTKAHVHVRINGVYAIRLTALCASSTTVSVRGRMGRGS